jgi:hypothetical protein
LHEGCERRGDSGLGVDLSDQPGMAFIAGHRADVFEELLDRGGGELGGECPAGLLADGGDDFVLAGEVPVDRPDGEPGGLDEVGHGRPGEAVAGEAGARGVDDLGSARVEMGLADSRHKRTTIRF